MSHPPLSAVERTALKTRLTSCFETLSALPDTSQTRPQGFLSHWPEMRRSAKNGAILHRAVARPRPSPEAISDCERLLDALYDLTPFQRQLLIARGPSAVAGFDGAIWEITHPYHTAPPHRFG